MAAQDRVWWFLWLILLVFDNAKGSFPIIDLSEFTEGSREQQDAVAKRVDLISREIGFFVIVNHKVNEKVIRRAWRAIEQFFDMPEGIKAESPQMTEVYPYGYSALGGESLAAGAGDETKVGDMKEMFATGPYDPRSGIVAPQYPTKPKAFQKAWHDYYVAMEDLSKTLLRLFARALELHDDDWFVQFSDKHACALRALNYPAQSSKTNFTQRASAHTDYGSLTILKSGGPGLQVKNRTSQEWVDVPFLDRSHFIINLGDLMNRWTNDRWVSTPHRVVFLPEDFKPAELSIMPPTSIQHHFSRKLQSLGRIISKKFKPKPNARRQSLAFFHNLNHDANVSAIQTCLQPGIPPKWPPILAHEHLMQKHLASTTGMALPDDTEATSTPAPSFKPPTEINQKATLGPATSREETEL